MKKLTTSLGILMACLCLFAPQGQGALSRVSGVDSTGGEGNFNCGIIDTTLGYVQFSSFEDFGGGITFGFVSEFSIPGNVLAYDTRYINFTFSNLGACVQNTDGFSYWVSSNTPSALQSVDLHGGVTYSSITFQSGQNIVGTGVIDTVNSFAYFGTNTSPGIVIKVALPVASSSMSIVGSLTLPAGFDNLTASVIDTTHGFAYFASSTTTGGVVKIDLSDFTLNNTLTFNSGEGGVGAAVIDPANNFAYFGTHDSPAKIVKVRLNSLTRATARTLTTGENDIQSATIDTNRSFAYFGTNTSPGIVVPIYLGDFTHKTSLTLGSGDDYLRAAVIDMTNGYAYFGTHTTPGRAIQVDLMSGAPEILANPTNTTAHFGQTAFFAVTADGRGLTYQWQMNGVDISGATSATYAHPIALTDDGASFQCVVTGTGGTVTSTAATLTIIPDIKVYPNPWRSDRHNGIDLTFDQLLANSTVKIFTLAAHWVITLPIATGTTTWNLTNDRGEKVASGYYFYIVTTGNDAQTVKGKIAIIR